MATCNKAGRHIFMAQKKETRAVSATYIIDILKISDIIISWEKFSDHCEDSYELFELWIFWWIQGFG